MARDIDEIKAFFCRVINGWGLGVKAIQTPTNKPAPNGTYIAVRDSYIEQHGMPLTPAPGQNNKQTFLQLLGLVITEVEGNGYFLREIRNCLQTESFRVLAESEGLSLWSMGEIQVNNFQDGDFWIRQSFFNLRVEFSDTLEYNAERIHSFDGTINDAEIKMELNQ